VRGLVGALKICAGFLFLNDALVDKDNPVGHFAGKAHLVGLLPFIPSLARFSSPPAR
jgi:hypothetical protein